MKRILPIVFAFSMIACHNNNPQKANEEKTTETVSIDKSDILSADILTSEQQAKLTPQNVLERLKQGNKDFTEDNLTVRNTTERVRKASLG
ncbi:hypothetical protein [Flavobacterium rivuli]|uniref:hypothetical protein n=1 Tax=Flavobacterium rivuli TaxID=498301 RepID=UPI0009DE776F|nr:hypothetical protein [Flavobacterium rivuli]